MEALSIDLPEELLIELLTRLPRKSLARFKCVSRKMCQLISNTVPMITVPKLLIFSCSWNKSVSFHSLDDKTCIERLFSPLEDDIVRHNKVEVRSSCHGLLLIQVDKDLFIWNPLTNFFRKVLTFCGLSFDSSKTFVVSLCYCSTNANYKVVLVEKTFDYSWDTQNFYVATCGDRSWENIEVDVNLENVFEGPFLKGYRYWIDRRYSFADCTSIRSHGCIFFFDPNISKFIEVASPQPKEENSSDNFLGIGVIDECLCISRWDDPGNYQGNIEFLVMKEFGNEISWEILFVISNTPEIRRHSQVKPLFRTKEGEILMITNMYGTSAGIKCYDDKGNFRRDVLVPAYKFFSDLILYEESWFSPTV